ncbi:MAG: hypothetical protein WD021_03205 [Rhodothermales bacterium]
MKADTKKYRQAAAAYLIYGILYLFGALYMAQTGASERAMGPGSVWWFLLGGAMVVALPVLIWKEYTWLTRVLAVLVGVRVVGLGRLLVRGEWDAVPMPWGGTLSEAYGAAVFFVVSVCACVLLARAGWGRWMDRRRGAGKRR